MVNFYVYWQNGLGKSGKMPRIVSGHIGIVKPENWYAYQRCRLEAAYSFFEPGYMNAQPVACNLDAALRAYAASGNGSIEPFTVEAIIWLLDCFVDADPLPVFV